MIITIADRFNFSSQEIFAMKSSRLKFWYNAVKSLHDQEQKQIKEIK